METNNNSRFSVEVGKDILCYYGLLIYKAKCTNVCRAINGKPLYYVHYTGWKKSYDEWVDYERILEVNSENLAKMVESHRLFSNVKKKKTKPSINKSRTNSRPKGKSSKLLSVESNQIKAATVSSEPNNISCQKKRGRPTKSKNNLSAFKTKPIDNKKLMDNLTDINSVDKNQKSRANQVKEEKPTYIKEEKATCIKEECNSLEVTRSIPPKQDPVQDCIIDLTKDEDEKEENNQLVFNIYVNSLYSLKSLINVHHIN